MNQIILVQFTDQNNVNSNVTAVEKEKAEGSGVTTDRRHP
uniref:Uncharacterized protein n=1 Tax=Caenorhabditis japonica TaxID=281687 RepID=A0A8R1ED56_CAEJA